MSIRYKLLMPLVAVALYQRGRGLRADAEDANKVMATVGGSPITAAEVKLAETELDPQFAKLPPDQRQIAALAALVDIRALAVKAKAEKLDETPEFKQRMAFLRDRALHNAYFKQKVADTITDADVRARYDKEIAAAPPVNEVHALHILVKTKEEAEAIIKSSTPGRPSRNWRRRSRPTAPPPKAAISATSVPARWCLPSKRRPSHSMSARIRKSRSIHSSAGMSSRSWTSVKKQPPAFDQVKAQVRSVLMRERYIDAGSERAEGPEDRYPDPAIAKAMKQATGGQ